MKKITFIILVLLNINLNFGQSAEFEVTYNNIQNRYEAYVNIVGSITGSLIFGGSGYTIVVPAGQGIPSNITNGPGTPNFYSWTASLSNTSTPDNADYIRFLNLPSNFSGNTAFASLDDGDRLLLFTFEYGGCVGNVRIYNNQPSNDPTSDDIDGGADLSNAFVVDNIEYYSDNRNNTGTTCTFTKNGDGDWNDPNNWIEVAVPTANDDAIILSGVTTFINPSETYSVRNLTVQSGTPADPTLMTIGNNAILNIQRDLTKTDDFEGEGYLIFDGSSDIVFRGDRTQQIIGDGTTAGSFSNIALNNDSGLLLTDDADITGVLEVDLGDFNVQNDGLDVNFFTFKSDDQNNTAVVAPVATGSSINGCIVVERYIPAKRAFRLLSSPVTTNTPGCSEKITINENLQEGEQVTDFTQYGSANPILGFGTHITGSTTGINGLDATETGNPSMFFYNNGTDPDNSGFSAVTNTIDTDESTLFAGEDFLLMVRGDRDLDLNDPLVANSQTGNATTLRFTGELATGDQIFNTGPDDDDLNGTQNIFNVIANPYQAQIDIHDVLNDASTSGVQVDQVWVFDPTTSGTFGNYVLIEFDASGNATTIPAALPADPNPINEFLQPNQSMFVQNLDTETPNPSITIKETHKTINTNTTTVFSAPNNQVLSVQLNLFTADDDLRDGVIVRMGNSYEDEITSEDAIKFSNMLENLSTNNNGTLLTSDKRRLDNANENVQLHLTNYTESGYVFKINVNNPNDTPVYLIDNYLGTQTLLDATYVEHNFNVDQSVPASIAADRFTLQFGNTTLSDDNFETSVSGIQVYPNPVENVVNISKGQFNGEWNTLNIYDITGKLVISLDKLDQDSELNVDMSNLSQGMYILKVNTSNGQYQEKLLKK
jgi:hypothetical protein